MWKGGRESTSHRNLSEVELGQWQSADALPGSGEDRVANGRSNGRNRRFADASRIVIRLHNHHVNLRHLTDPHHVVLIEIGLLHAPLIDGDGALQSGQSVNNAALDLLLDAEAFVANGARVA